MQKLFSIFLVVMLAVAFPAPFTWAQRPLPGTGGGVQRPPPASPGAATTRQRQIDKGQAERVKDKKGDGKTQSGDDPPVEPTPSPPVAPVERKRTPVDAKVAAEFLTRVKERVERVKSLHFDAEVLILGGDSSARIEISYDGRRAPTGLVQHRVTIKDAVEGGEKLRDVFLIHEYPGERSHGWHLTPDAKPKPYPSDPLLYRMSKDVPFLLVDLLPFAPERYTLTHTGEGTFDAQPVSFVKAVQKVGLPVSIELAINRFSHLPLQAVATRGADRVWESVESELRNRDGVPAFERRKILYQDDRIVVIRITARRVNHHIDPRKLEPETFATH